MRLSAGDELLLFNGRDGEWRARLAAVGKRGATLAVVGAGAAADRRARPRPGRRAGQARAAGDHRREGRRAGRAARAAGASPSAPTPTAPSVDRLAAIAVEAAEQTGRLDVPQIEAPEKLDRLLADWPADRPLMFCDEAGDAPPALDGAGRRAAGGPWGVLIGPEGGFSPAERALIRALPAAVAGLARPAHPARRHRGDRGADPMAGGARRSAGGLELPRLARPDDLATPCEGGEAVWASRARRARREATEWPRRSVTTGR